MVGSSISNLKPIVCRPRRITARNNSVAAIMAALFRDYSLTSALQSGSLEHISSENFCREQLSPWSLCGRASSQNDIETGVGKPPKGNSI